MNSPASLKMYAVTLGDALGFSFSWQDHLHGAQSLCNMLKFTLRHDIEPVSPARRKPLRDAQLLLSHFESMPTTYYATCTVFNILFQHYK